MDWIKLQDTLSTAYDTVSAWCTLYPGEAGFIAGVVVLGSLSYLINRKARKRSRLHRLLWGVKMRRSRNRLPFERSSLAAAIEDCLFEMEYAGDITKDRADGWRHSFANYYQMDELLPVKDKASIKRGIKYRLNKGIHQVKSIIPGGLAAVKADTSYKPIDNGSKMRSKFA